MNDTLFAIFAVGVSFMVRVHASWLRTTSPPTAICDFAFGHPLVATHAYNILVDKKRKMYSERDNL